MEHVFIIAGSSDVANSLTRFFNFLRGSEVQTYIRPSLTQGQQPVELTFKRIADWIETSASQSNGSLRDSIVFIELLETQKINLGELDPLARDNDWASVVGMLILAFPEVHWVFLSRYEPVDPYFYEESHLFRVSQGLKGILKLHDDGFTPLFDPTGLRNDIRAQAKAHDDEHESGAYIALRDRVAAAIDEEQAYTCFNAYAAFRFGFRCHAITTYEMMNKILGPQSNLTDTHRPTLVFEDVYLRFPDIPEKLSLSELSIRDSHFPTLTRVNYRIFVTVGHRRGAYAERSRRNEAHLNDFRPAMWIKERYKPSSGMFDLWHRSGLGRKLSADGFKWNSQLASQKPKGGHSAPGRLLVIAEHLIGRSNAILRSADSVPTAVHGAVLASEAQELLGNRTPTTMLEALALKHKLEVLAECMFYGVEHNMDVRSRFDEIERDVASARQWFHPRKARVSALNAQIRIINELSLIFREHNQFDEEQQCLAKLRELHRHLWFCKHASWAWAFYPARWYIDFLLSSVSRFVLAILVWLAGFWLLFAAVHHTEETYEVSRATHGLVDSVTSFFGLQLAHDLDQLIAGSGIVWINLVAILAGFVHLGILISHLYSIIARR